MLNKRTYRRLLPALLLAAALLLSLLPRPAYAVDAWLEEPLAKLQSWNVISGDATGNLHLNSPITRAEFSAMINRAYGYSIKDKIPFTDVPLASWYYDDIAIGYNTGYFSGTAATTAEPDAPLTREQAVTLLARNLRFEENAGEVTGFTDGRRFSDWSRSYIKTASDADLIHGYEDGTFRPQNNITRGEMVKLLGDAVGTLVNTEGRRTLGGVPGNLTITTPNCTLRDTTVYGDLYLTGGVGLGDVTLENVKVLGRIVIAGGGESERGDASVTLRNVEAPELIIDSIADQYVSLRTETDSDIDNVIARTSCYIEDNSRNRRGNGLQNISLEGADGAKFTLAGNIKNAVNRTPKSTLTVAKGVTDNLTIDEKAIGSTLTIASDATVNTLNLDVGIPVTGNGDIGELVVSAPGATVAMLPDTITIRPGLYATVHGERMDTKAGEESSADPRLLSGYPEAKDIAPTSISALFSGNKKGTVYWAITPYSNGPVEEAETLIKPPTYGPTITKQGSIKLAESDKEANAKVTGLTTDGTYYLSAVLVDDRDQESDIKYVSFTTPDNTVPNFTTGYPYLSLVTNTDAQVTAMTTKSCQLYYALLPKNAAAPKDKDFLAAGITGNLGYGRVYMTKNVPETFYVNDVILEELEDYDLYLWLTDEEGGLSSAVKKLSFKTVDKTPPVFVNDLKVTKENPTSLALTAAINEKGTVYWALVPAGSEYPKPPTSQSGSGSGTDSGGEGTVTEVDLSSEYAKMQVMYGLNALKSGKQTAQENKDFSFTISGLTVQTSYDIYYVAVDSAGNYSERVQKLTANTQDSLPPEVRQEFTRFANDDATRPYANTDIQLIFNEGVKYAVDNQSLLELYKKVEEAATDADWENARNDLAAVLQQTVQLYSAATGNRLPVQVKARTADNQADDDWVIDYRNAKIYTDPKTNELVILFETTNDENLDSALNLSAGNTYYFELHDLADTSSNSNLMGVTTLPRFTTIAAQAFLEELNITRLENVPSESDPNQEKESDIAFSLTPLSTSSVDDSVDWDMLLWLNTSADFELWQRERASENATPSEWELAGTFSITTTGSYEGQSLGRLNGLDDFPQLNSTLQEGHVYEYAVHFTQLGDLADRKAWSQRVNMQVSVVAGNSVSLANLGADVSGSFDSMVQAEEISDIGTPKNFRPYKQFDDQQSPQFMNQYPTFEPGDTSVYMNLLLNRTGTVYYVVAPVDVITTQDKNGQRVIFDDVPEGGGTGSEIELSTPVYRNIVTPTSYTNPRIKKGTATVGTSVNPILITDLEPQTDYYAYMVIKGQGQIYSPVYLYRFTTQEVVRPVITLDLNNPSVNISTNISANVDYLLIAYNNQMVNRLTREFQSAFTADELANINIPADYRTISVLEAMYTPITINGESRGSVFDEYATQRIKDDMANYIRATNPDGSNIIGKGSSATNQNPVSVNCSTKWKLSPRTQYAMLAVGKSTLGSGDAFSAIYPITLVDDTPPMVNQVLSTLYVDGGRISGTVTLVFSEELYRLKPNTNPPQLQMLDAGPLRGATRPDDWVSINSLIRNQSTGITFVDGEPMVLTNTLEIDFNRVLNGGYIACQPQICDQFSNVNNTPLSVQANIKSTTTNGQTTQWVEITIPKDWDARTK